MLSDSVKTLNSDLQFGPLVALYVNVKGWILLFCHVKNRKPLRREVSQRFHKDCGCETWVKMSLGGFSTCGQRSWSNDCLLFDSDLLTSSLESYWHRPLLSNQHNSADTYASLSVYLTHYMFMSPMNAYIFMFAIRYFITSPIPKWVNKCSF